MLAAVKSEILHFPFKSVGQEEWPPLIGKYMEDKKGEKGANRNEYAVFFLNCSMILKKDEMTDNTCVQCNV